jgi:hypothetical protein
MVPRGTRGGSGRGAGGGRTAAFSAARGALLVGLAVVIGIVLLQVIDDGTTGPIGDGGAAASNGTTSTTAAGATTTTTTGAPEKTPAEVAVLVQNGSGRPGAARAQTDALKAKGYQTLTPADASGRTGTIVYFQPGLERECTAVATAVGGAPKVEAMPTPAPTGSENANCVVILGA